MRFTAMLCCLGLLLGLGCKKAEKPVQKEETVPPSSAQAYSPAEVENAVIYEANIRQYSPEGSFKAFTKDIPQLKKLGVKVLWVMPIQPISMTKRKATNDLSIEDIKDDKEKEKYLGSYYAISDYTAVNEDYGTLADFKELVNTAHKNGMFVILDWVANHTGWDHHWLEEHPEYFQKNKEGEITDPLNPETGEPWGWTDVAHLSYKNAGLHKAMIAEMRYWIKETDIDGFRCDVADNVPLDFWEDATAELQMEKQLFMLMESDDSAYLKTVFDMGYGWPMHHLFNDIASGDKNVADLDELLKEQEEKYQKEDILMYFTSNHDENSWNGSEYERLREDAVEVFAALTYMLPGMPLIYNGQEYDFKDRLKFFEKDSLTHEKGKMFAVYEKLGKLKNENLALHGGVHKASYERINTSNNENILAFKREKEGNSVYFIANLSDTKQEAEIPLNGTFQNYMSDSEMELEEDKSLILKPWEYLILMD